MKFAILSGITGGILASAGVGASNWQLYAVLVALLASYVIGVNEV